MFSGEDVEKKVSVLSGGERARLALACMLLRPFNLLVLDEPTNHLDILSKEVLKEAIMKYNGTLIVVSHDRQFLSGLTEKTLEFRDRKTYEYLGDVNYFLKKRELANMREVELHKTKSKQPTPKAPAQTSTIDADKLKKLERQSQNIERKIEVIEKEIAAAEKQMGIDGFYQSAESDKVLADYNDKKSKLDELMASWEEVQEAMM